MERKRLVLSERNLRMIVTELLQNADRNQRGINETASGQVTVGNLKAALKLAREKKIKDLEDMIMKDSGNMAAQLAIDILAPSGIGAAINAASGAKSIIPKISKLYSIMNSKGVIISDKEKTASPLMNVLTLDPGKKKVLDREVEQNFLQWFMNEIDSLPDNVNISDIDEALNNWLKRNYQGVFLGPT
jgi:hypothetical protein